jgi:hypothetical protein
MPNDLERAFGELAADTGRAQLLPAAEVRRLAGNRARRGSIAAVAAVAVLVAGVTVGGRWVLADGEGRPRPLPPVQSIGVSPAPSSSPSQVPSGLPSSPAGPPATSKSASSPPAPTMPSSIPARAVLTAADGNMGELTALDVRKPPAFCSDTTYPSSSRAAVQKTVKILYRPPNLGADHTATDDIYNTVGVYRGDGAADFLDELRAAVRDCPNGKIGDIPAKNRLLGSLGLGDESLLIERSFEARDDLGEPVGNGKRSYAYVAVVRIGDAVTRIESYGYESVSSDREVVGALTRKVADRLADWRG